VHIIILIKVYYYIEIEHNEMKFLFQYLFLQSVMRVIKNYKCLNIINNINNINTVSIIIYNKYL